MGLPDTLTNITYKPLLHIDIKQLEIFSKQKCKNVKLKCVIFQWAVNYGNAHNFYRNVLKCP